MFYDGSPTSIVILVVIIVFAALPCALMIIGCVFMRCCATANFSCCPTTRAQHVLTQHIGRRRMRFVAHRGGCAEKPENTIPAFRHAIAHGVGVLELDLAMSRDGVVLVAHDDTLERVIAPEWLRAHPECVKVGDLVARNPEELPPLARRIRLHFATADKTHYSEAEPDQQEREQEQDQERGEQEPRARICTLDEVLDLCERQPEPVALHIDLKNGKLDLVHATLRLLAERAAASPAADASSGARSKPVIIIGSANSENQSELSRQLGRARGLCAPSCDEHACCGLCICCCCCCTCGQRGDVDGGAAAAGTTAPDAPQSEAQRLIVPDSLAADETVLFFASVMQVGVTYLLWYLGLLWLCPLPFDVFSVFGPSRFALDRFGGGGGGEGPGCLMRLIVWLYRSPRLWRYLRSRGVTVFLFVLNTEECWREMHDLSEAFDGAIDGLMTDEVTALERFYQTRQEAFMNNFYSQS